MFHGSDFELDDTADKRVRFQKLRNKKFGFIRESPVNPLIAENLPYAPIIFGYGLIIPASVLIFYIIGYYSLDKNDSHPLRLLYQLPLQQAAQALGTAVRTTVNILVLLVSSSGVILQLASNRYHVNTYRLFFSDRKINFYIAFATFSTTYSCLVAFSNSVDTTYIHFHVISCLVLLILTILLAFPYFYYLFDWLDPVKTVHRLQYNIFVAINVNNYDSEKVNSSKIDCIRNLDYLADIARFETQKHSKTLAFSVIDSIMMICHHYLKLKPNKRNGWFEIPYWLRETPDFVSMSEDLYQGLEVGHLWFEFKVFRTLLSLYREGVKDLSFLVTTHTRKLAERAILNKDMSLLTLCIQFFNTYLRTALSGNQTRMAYTVMDQYRLLCEFMLLSISSENTPENLPHISLPISDRKKIKALMAKRWNQSDLANGLRGEAHQEKTDDEIQQTESLLCKVVGIYWPYYHRYSLRSGLDLIAETIAHDTATVLEVAFVCNVAKHDDMLKTVLNPTYPVQPTGGTLRAFVKLACSYIVLEADQFAQEIAKSLANVPEDALAKVWRDLLAVEDRDFWEINDRLINFNYMNSAQKQALPKFFAYFGRPVASPAE